MSDIEKACRAIRITYAMLREDRKSDAEGIAQMAYACSGKEAVEFVQVIEDIYDVGN